MTFVDPLRTNENGAVWISQEDIGKTCMDGGKCHHTCQPVPGCFRRAFCEPLTDAINNGLTFLDWKIDFQDSIGIDCNKGFPDEPNTTELQQAYRLGFMRAAQWANRDDLKSDVGSPAYLKDMAEDLSK